MFDEKVFDAHDSLDYSIANNYPGVFERSRKQQSNNQVNRNGQQPKQSRYDSHKQSIQQQLQQQFSSEETEQGAADPYRGNVYEMDS